MELLELIRNRRSIRKYTGEAIDDEKMHKILTAGLLAPTSRNRKLCEFHVVQDKRLLFQMACAKSAGGMMLKDCDKAIVVCADSDTWLEDCSIAMSFMMLEAQEEGVACCWVQLYLREEADETVARMLGLGKKMHLCGALALGVGNEEKNPHSFEEADFSKVFTH